MDLLQALQAGDMSAIRAALKENPAWAKNPRAPNTAASHANLPALQLLHKHGADLNAVWRNYRPIHNLMQSEPHAATATPQPERLACLEWMLAHGADPELTGAWPPARGLIIAAFAGRPDFVKVLRAGGARVDGFSGAALGNHNLVAKTLAKDPDFALARDSGVLTALQCACGTRLPKVDVIAMATILLDGGADPNAQTKTYGGTVDAAYFACGANHEALFELLLERGADATDAAGHAVWRKRFHLAERTLPHGANLDLATANGKPLLNDLIRWGQIPQTLWMLANGASPNVPDADGWTAVHQAVSRGNARVLDAVIRAGADLNRRDHSNRTPLDLARALQRDKLAAMLV